MLFKHQVPGFNLIYLTILQVWFLPKFLKIISLMYNQSFLAVSVLLNFVISNSILNIQTV